jgi:hypothetical protein
MRVSLLYSARSPVVVLWGHSGKLFYPAAVGVGDWCKNEWLRTDKREINYLFVTWGRNTIGGCLADVHSVWERLGNLMDTYHIARAWRLPRKIEGD